MDFFENILYITLIIILIFDFVCDFKNRLVYMVSFLLSVPLLFYFFSPQKFGIILWILIFPLSYIIFALRGKGWAMADFCSLSIMTLQLKEKEFTSYFLFISIPVLLFFLLKIFRKLFHIKKETTVPLVSVVNLFFLYKLIFFSSHLKK